jgi:prepilin-type processing-associated H-X9-DG protein/prepilin-type N-terminal cleavage/methylation domain-containing protein
MRRALTLIEVLVCIGLVAVLSSLAASAVSSALSATRTAACANNLRHLGAAAHAYMSSNRDALPAAVLFEIGAGSMRQVMWDHTRAADGTIEPGPLWIALDRPFAVMRCPCCTQTAGDPDASGYNYNTTFLAAEGHYPVMGPDGCMRSGWDAVRPGLPPAARRRPTDTALFGEGGWRGGANRFMRAPGATVEGDLPTVYAGGQAFRHLGSTNVGWLDGHVAPVGVPWAGVHSTPPLANGTLGFPGNGFLSEDDSAYDPR